MKNSLECPVCHSLYIKVTDGRPSDPTIFRRRRECQDCKHRWTTWETLEKPDVSWKRPTDWQRLTDTQRRAIGRLIKDFADSNQKVVRIDRLGGVA